MSEAKSEKRKLIELKQQELKRAGLNNKIMQFDIKILELEEEIERLNENKQLCTNALEEL